MALNKESNAYTFLFSIALVAVVGTILSSLSLGLKPMQERNREVKKKIDILAAVGIDSDRSNAEKIFSDVIIDSYVISSRGEVLENEVAFDVDVQKQIRDKKIKPEDRLFPIFLAKKDGNPLYVLPVVGKGLWGPLWGYVAVDGEDRRTIRGTSFSHKSETPGLGAEINQAFFQDRFVDAKLSNDEGVFSPIQVVKDGTGRMDSQRVDGISGGTITSKGVEEMMNRTMRVYHNYFSQKQ
jgi:Na+-transporting NADH:ubiquinone oxidoreductase subunit C